MFTDALIFVFLAIFARGNVLSSQGAIPQLLSAFRSLTSVFGMGTGVSFKPSSPHYPLRVRACALKTKQYLIPPTNLTASAWLSPRPISNGPLHTSLHFHFHPIYHIISVGSYFHKGMGNLISRRVSHLDAFSVYLVHT